MNAYKEETILIVEDDPQFVILLAMPLRKRGMAI